jgi:hypothetical protein
MLRMEAWRVHRPVDAESHPLDMDRIRIRALIVIQLKILIRIRARIRIKVSIKVIRYDSPDHHAGLANCLDTNPKKNFNAKLNIRVICGRIKFNFLR